MNPSKMNDIRFWKKWCSSGAVRLNIKTPLHVDAFSKNHRTGWNTASCLESGRYVYFVTRFVLKAPSILQKLPSDAISFERGRELVML
jgi:hypothetical protein